ncbi:unnamed protein product [Parascedosporium putredinis]|uniref:Uncharacterized protein n=1 Tax=Parascedosporium putredinis TaxID=1442378 RepID=A0A9P1GWU3_9PEZI|nr:unnamed protein product [Parascedosporium putredinis]CAI7989069.1 unnamed protein product [Parascedosporium putredinis]
MATWKERGEVPDSEDEFGSDTDENATLPSATPVLDTQTKNVTDNKKLCSRLLPGSSRILPEREPIARNLSASPGSRTTGKEIAGSGGFDSQPTCLPTADPEVDEPREAERRVDIEPAAGDQLGPRHTVLSGAESTDLGAEEGPLDFSLSNDESIDFPPEYLQFQDFGLGNRTFRPRKPIQKHPYALENALYSKIFKSHGLKPVRLETQSSQRRNPEPEDDSQERDFEDETQETGDTVDLSDESQAQAPLDEPQIHVDLPSSPITPIASLPPHHGALAASQA